MHERGLRREREAAPEVVLGARPVVLELVSDRSQQRARDRVPGVELERAAQRLGRMG
jgi:hypothetical protein